MKILERLKAYLFPEPPPTSFPCVWKGGGPIDGKEQEVWINVISGGVWAHKMESGNLALYNFRPVKGGSVVAVFDTVICPERELK